MKVYYNNELIEVEEKSGGYFHDGIRLNKKNVILPSQKLPPEWEQFKFSNKDCLFHISPPKEGVMESLESVNIDERIKDAIISHFGYTALYKHQVEGIHESKDKDLLCSVDVSGCKSLIALTRAIEDFFETGRQTVYICPTNALANSQMFDYGDLLEDLGLTYTRFGKGAKGDPSASVIFTNFYALDFLLRRNDFDPSNIGTVVIDELHLIAGGVEGGHLSCVLKRVEIAKEQVLGDSMGPFHVTKYIGLSATISKPKEVFRKVVGRTPYLLSQGYATTGEKTFVFKYKKNKKEPKELTLALIKAGYSGLYFIDSKKRCMDTAEELNQLYGGEVAAYYHADMKEPHKKLVIQRFRDGEIKFVISTACLEAGVNFPSVCRVVIIDGFVEPASLAQRAGRAGRDGRPSLVVSYLGKDVHSLEWYKDRPTQIVLPSTNPRIDAIHAKRLLKTLGPDYGFVCEKKFPNAAPGWEKGFAKAFDESLFSSPPKLHLIGTPLSGKKQVKVSEVPVSTAMGQYVPGSVVSVWSKGTTRNYLIDQLTSAGNFATETEEPETSADSCIFTDISDNAIIFKSLYTAGKQDSLVLGYGELTDSCSKSSITYYDHVKGCKRCRKLMPHTTKRCGCGSKSFGYSFRKRSETVSTEFPRIAFSYEANFLHLKTSFVNSGMVYAMVRSLCHKLSIPESSISVTFQGKDKGVVFHDSHPHSDFCTRLFENLEQVLELAKKSMVDCHCNDGCVACNGKTRGSNANASNKTSSIEMLNQFAKLRFHPEEFWDNTGSD